MQTNPTIRSLGLLGRIAVQMGMISPEQLSLALSMQVEEAEPRQIGQLLLSQGLIDERKLDQLVAAQARWRNILMGAEQGVLPPTRQRKKLSAMASLLPDTARPGEVDPVLLELLYNAWDDYASDLHVHAGAPPFVRVDGTIRKIGRDPVPAQRVAGMIRSFVSDEDWAELQERGDVDLAWQPHPSVRCRVNAFVSKNGAGVSLRLIPAEPASLEDLGLPSTLARCVGFHQGLVLVTGPSGSGKSSTVASLLRLVNEERPDNIITVEDPIEFVHNSVRSAVLQREVGPHTAGFAEALRGALRQDPDVLMVGELRDLETVQLAISAAETGHLVLATMHTSNAAGTIDRLVGTFPAMQQSQVRAMLSESLRAIVSQKLIKRADGPGRVPACEIVFNTPSVANLIREGRTFQLANIIALARQAGMRSMRDSLRELYEAGLISKEEIARAAP